MKKFFKGLMIGVLFTLVFIVGANVIAESYKYKQSFWTGTTQNTQLQINNNMDGDTFASKTVAIAKEGKFVVHNSLWIEVVTTTVPLVVVDLSDTTNWRHQKTNNIVVTGIEGSLCANGATVNEGKWLIRLGTVVENDATNGTVYYWYETEVFVKELGFGECTPIAPYTIDRYTEVDIVNENLKYIVTGTTQEDNQWQNDAAITNFLAGTSLVGVGDVVAEVVALEGDGTAMLYQMTIEYYTN